MGMVPPVPPRDTARVCARILLLTTVERSLEPASWPPGLVHRRDRGSRREAFFICTRKRWPVAFTPASPSNVGSCLCSRSELAATPLSLQLYCTHVHPLGVQSSAHTLAHRGRSLASGF